LHCVRKADELRFAKFEVTSASRDELGVLEVAMFTDAEMSVADLGQPIVAVDSGSNPFEIQDI
jgi:hypothetical protein